jgi:hypothetical protein
VKIKNVLILISIISAVGMAQTGGQYAVSQSAIAGGAAASDDGLGGQFSITGTVGQAAAGANSVGSQYRVSGGFWQSSLAPTATGVSIEGRVVTVFGSPLAMSTVVLSDVEGNTRIAISNPFGRFRFEEVEAGRGYFIIAKAKGLSSDPQFINADQDITGIELIAFEQ